MKLQNKFTLSKRSSLLASVLLATIVLTASNLPSAQKETHRVETTRNKVDKLAKDAVFPFVPITPEKLINPMDYSLNNGEINNPLIEEIVVELEHSAPLEVKSKQVAKVDLSTPAIIKNEQKTVVGSAENLGKDQKIVQKPEPKGINTGMEIVRTVQVAQEEMHIFKKDLSALQSWRYAVQVAAVYGGSSTDDLVDYLSNKGYSPIIWESEDKKGRKFQRIWIGLYQEKEQARAAREYYNKHEKKQAFVTPVAWDAIDR